MKPLKDREEKILQFMASEIKLKGYPPTVREICSALNIKCHHLPLCTLR